MRFIRGEYIKCLCDHKDVCEGELPFSEGDVLEVVAVEVDENWLTAKNARGEEGSIYTRCVEKYNYEPLIRNKTNEYLGYGRHGCMGVVSPVKANRPSLPLPRKPDEVHEYDYPVFEPFIKPSLKANRPPCPLPKPRKPIRKPDENYDNDYDDAEPLLIFPKRTSLNKERIRKDHEISENPEADTESSSDSSLNFSPPNDDISEQPIKKHGEDSDYDDVRQPQRDVDYTYQEVPAFTYADALKERLRKDHEISENPEADTGSSSDSSLSSSPPNDDISEVWTPGQPVECLSNYEAVDVNDLSFSKGDILTIVSVTLNKNYYLAKDIYGSEGVIGKNFVRKYITEVYAHDNNASVQEPTVEFHEIFTPGQLVECVFNSDGLYDEDFSISKGEILMIVKATKDKKWYVAKNVQGREGFVEAKCVQKHLDLLANQASVYAMDGYSSIKKSLREKGCHERMIQDENWYFHKGVTKSGHHEEQCGNVEDYTWFHGKINREVSENLLQPRQDGLFLIRYTSLENAVYALSLRCKETIHHIPIQNEKNKLTIDGRRCFETLTELVEHYTKFADNLPTRLTKACAKAGGSESCVAGLNERFMTALNEAKQKIYPVDGNIVEKALARFRYATSNSNELNLTEGDVINIHNKDLEDYGWWIGEHHGHIGAFPCTHVKVMKKVIFTPNQRVKCVVNSCVSNEEHLPFSRQDILTIISGQTDETCCVAKNVSGRKGLIPTHCVEKYEDLEAYMWFHGNITREVSEKILQPRQDGLFLVRYSPISEADYVLTVCFEERNLHFLIRNDRYGLNIDGGCSFDTLAELVKYYTKDPNGLPTRLIKACPKPEGFPNEILCMDEDAQNIYREALQAGKEKIYNIRLMIVGHHGVGKTTLAKRLLEKNINEEEREPTEGVEVHDRCCQIDHDTRKWKTVKADVHPVKDQRILGIVQKHLNLKQNHERSETEINILENQTNDARKNVRKNYLQVQPVLFNTGDSETDRVSKTSLDTITHPSTVEQMGPLNSDASKQDKYSIQDGQSNIIWSPVESGVKSHDTGICMPSLRRTQSTSSTELGKLHSESCGSNDRTKENGQRRISRSRPQSYTLISINTNNKATEEIQKYIDSARPLTFTESTMSDVTMLDFAGHFMFYTTHQAFMSWRTQYILVTDITLSLNDTVQKDICDMDISGDRTYSPLEYILYWMNAIHSHACLPSENELSTSNTDWNPEGRNKCPPVILVATHADKIPKDKVELMKRTYFKKVREALRDRPLRFHLTDEDFAITNIGPEHGIDALKSKILEIAEKQEYWGEEVPARWLLLEQVLMNLKRQGIVIIELSEVESRNQSLQVKIESSEELQLFLRFEHDLGNIVYISTEKLRDKIVLQPQWLINGLKVLMTSAHIVNMYPDLLEDWCNFRDTGRLTKRLLDVLWSHHSDYHDNQHHLLDLMEKLNIIAKPRNIEEENLEVDWYWVPCMVHKTVTDDVRTLGEGDDVKKTSTLCFKSKTKFLHVGVFHRLLASCVSKWSPATDGEKYLLFSGLCVFEVDDCHNLMLSMNDYVINATMIRFSNKVYPDKSLCIKTRDYLQTTLSEIASCLCPNSEFEICIKCNKSAPQKNDGLHNISSLRKNEEVRCAGHGVIHRVESNELLQFWEASDAKLPKNVLPAQSALATDRFMRIYSVVVDTGTNVLRRLLHYYAVTPQCSLDLYLKRHTQTILELKKKKVLNQSQISIIFPQTGDSDIKQYDITLLSALLNNIVPALGLAEKQRVVDLRSHRNTLMHSNSTRMSLNDFQSMWTNITTTLTDLSKLCGDTTFEEEIQTGIQEIQKSASSDFFSRMDSVEVELKQMRRELSEMKKHVASADQGL